CREDVMAAERAANRVRGASVELVEAGRKLRRRQTLTEGRLWAALRDRGGTGWKFRRQYPVGRFVLDFCCPELHLVVEVDGPIHDQQTDEDRARTAALEAYGYCVLRFPNDTVLNDLPAVLDKIRQTTDDLQHVQQPHERQTVGQSGEAPS